MKWTYLAWMAVAVMLVTGSMSLAADATPGTVNGTITKVEKESITISLRSRDKTAAPETKTLALTDKTTVLVEKEPAAAGEKPKTDAGTVADLKEKKRVSVKCSEDGKTALEIIVRIPRAPRAAK
jgi:hypothetical protein